MCFHQPPRFDRLIAASVSHFQQAALSFFIERGRFSVAGCSFPPPLQVSRNSRREQRLRQDQSTVGMRRAERKEQEALAQTKKNEATLTKAQRIMELQKERNDINPRPARIARPGKPLKR